jgi:hypothetical protein
MSFLRFLMLLALIVWVGGLIFFPVVAATAFSVLPTTHLAGQVVRRSLWILHWMGMASGLVFLSSSMLYHRLSSGRAHIFSAAHLLVCLMLALTLVSQFGIIPRRDTLRASVADIGRLPDASSVRVQFDALHLWSTRVEEGVLILGLAATYLVARQWKAG